jgi:adenylate cyclase class 2
LSNRRAVETEIKLAVEDAAAVRRLLRGAGFRVKVRRSFEINLLFDHPSHNLRGKGLTLRVRKTGSQWLLTYKGPATAKRHKSRVEIETPIADGDAFLQILDGLGFQQCFRYEKYRTVFHAPGKSGLIMLDETPIGTYLEVEGTGSWIDRTATRLGFSERDYITSSYASLFNKYRGTKRTVPECMIFAGKA